MNRTSPKPFQQAAIESGLQIFAECKRQLDAAGTDLASRAAAIGHHGTLLLEAPTGAGKTLIAGHLAERFSAIESVVWFWFAPFKGVTGQTTAALRAELPGLRLRELAEDRQLADSRAADVFVTTWQAVATRVKDRRNVHKPAEMNLTIEELVVGLREKGMRLGVVIDEAHHGFFGGSGETQAMKFFREILRPEYTVLVTATPDDKDTDKFQKELGLARLNRITIGRREPVDEGLIKEGIKCVAYFAPEGQEKLVDFEGTALREGARLHQRLKDELKALGVQLTPLLLVQVDSREESVKRAKERLLQLGFTDEQVAIHTADEPDSGLLALANDESREVLVFKMAVALGFDAPRATTLVSMRAARDEDFGVQLVGRILRVHRKLQGRARAKALSQLLSYGYVFLADAAAQAGLDLAGQRINKLQTEYAKVSPTTSIVQIGGQVHVQVLGPGGQMHLLQITPPQDFSTRAGTEQEPAAETAGKIGGFTLELLSGGYSVKDLFPNPAESPIKPGERTAIRVGQSYRYELRASVPRRFKTHLVSLNNDVTEEDCAHRFMLRADDILRGLAAKVKVKRQTEEIFTQQIELEFTNVEMDADQTARAALKVLMKNETFDPRELRRALLRKLKAILREIAIDAAEDDEKASPMLDVILCSHPELLFAAQKAALAEHSVIEDTEEELPPAIVSDDPLTTSRLNVYGVYPPKLNTWELPFAQLLDQDTEGVIRWWHRNVPHKPWSVQVVLDNGKPFFPDFVVGVEGRRNESGGLLADPKFFFEIKPEEPKAYSRHPIYGRVLILSRQGGGQWFTVRYDEHRQKAVLDREFRLVDAVGY